MSSDSEKSEPSPWLLVVAAATAMGLLLGSGRRSPSPDLPKRLPGRQTDEPEPAPFGEPRSTDEPLQLQHARAREQGRGREAESPSEIPLRGWKDIFWRTVEEASNDRLIAVAGGVVFFAMLAMVPTLTALVSAYGLFADVRTIGEHLSVAAGLLPAASFELLREQVVRISGKSQVGLTGAFISSLAIALWSANAGMKAVFDALNVIYDEEEKRSFIRLNIVTLLFTVGALGAFLLAIGFVVVFPLLLSALGANGLAPVIISVARWPVLLLAVSLALAVLYRYGPSRHNAEWRWLTSAVSRQVLHGLSAPSHFRSISPISMTTMPRTAP